MSYKKSGRTGFVVEGGTYIPPRQPESSGDCGGDITSPPKQSPSQPPQPQPAAGADGSVTVRAGDLTVSPSPPGSPDRRGNAPVRPKNRSVPGRHPKRDELVSGTPLRGPPHRSQASQRGTHSRRGYPSTARCTQGWVQGMHSRRNYLSTAQCTRPPTVHTQVPRCPGMAFYTAALTRQPALSGLGQWRSPKRLATGYRPLGAPSERYVPKGRPLLQGLPAARVFPPRSRPPTLQRSLLWDAPPKRARKPALVAPARAAPPLVAPTVTNVTRAGTRSRGRNFWKLFTPSRPQLRVVARVVDKAPLTWPPNRCPTVSTAMGGLRRANGDSPTRLAVRRIPPRVCHNRPLTHTFRGGWLPPNGDPLREARHASACTRRRPLNPTMGAVMMPVRNPVLR
ncbi:uncharacterized protein DKFZp434B061-like [Asterias rubens]|uniref:uncharacterized protein DKFZp434B061-like n=1 Tax=Asterias rubens TaxID=7604 RepID=UPI00145534EB|nr:uncharacterized protein DKFZp434B061-like [Asterias rubens]